MHLHRRLAVVKEFSCSSISAWRAFHRDLPEIHAMGESPQDAVGRLVDRLSRSLEHGVDSIALAVLKQALAGAKSCVCECQCTPGTSRGTGPNHGLGDPEAGDRGLVRAEAGSYYPRLVIASLMSERKTGLGGDQGARPI